MYDLYCIIAKLKKKLTLSKARLVDDVFNRFLISSLLALRLFEILALAWASFSAWFLNLDFTYDIAFYKHTSVTFDIEL